MNPLSLQKRGLVHWFPLGRIDILNSIIADRRYRTSPTVSRPATWSADAHRGLYGMTLMAPVGTGVQFVPAVSVAPVTITFWARHLPGWTTNGTEVVLGNDTSGGWHGFFTSLTDTSFVANHIENNDFSGPAEVLLPVTLNDWHFCGAVFVSNSYRWAYCDGKAGIPNTYVMTPVVPKDVLRIGSGPASLGYPSTITYSTLRDIRVYNYALSESQLTELYRNPYDLYAQFDRDDDYQFFPATGPVESLTVPALSVPVALHTPEIFTPVSLEVPALAVTTGAPAPALLSDLGFQVSALTVSVTAHTPSSVNFEEEVIVEDERELEPHNFKVRIVDYVGGDDLRISRTYTELPGGVTIGKGYLTIKRYAKDDTDANAVLQKQITASEGVTGQITDASTVGGSIELYFDLTGAETATLTPLIAYHYDVQVISQAGAVYTCEKGVIVMQQGVTDATN